MELNSSRNWSYVTCCVWRMQGRSAFDSVDCNSNKYKTVDDYLNTFLFAGITEEIVFRGLILQQISESLAFWKSNIITSLLFLTIHYPIWIYTGEFSDLWSHMYVFFLGLFFGFVYKKTGSLWSVVLLHSFYNFFIIMI